METGTQGKESSVTEKVTLETPDVSQTEWEQLRAGKEVVRAKSASVAKGAAVSETVDESDTSKADDEVIDDEDADDESEVVEDRPKKKSGTQRRIKKLIKQRTDAEQEREYWRQEALKAQAQKPADPIKEEKVTAKEGKPGPDDFETHEDYILAIAEWKADEKIKSLKEQERQEKLRTERESVAAAFKGKVEEFKEANDDFESVVSDVDDVLMSLAVQQAILESDNGPELMYELAKNREEYERICSLPAMQAARAIGRFEAKIAKSSEEKKPEVKTKQTTKAPPPARPMKASSANGKMSINDEDISQRDYERLRAEQEKRSASY